ncbi:MAG: DUF2089 domain-containing protein [Spirochaetes bacterium]|nr:DUF2089 domain-containing protein [Spirochaetota bacterium]
MAKKWLIPSKCPVCGGAYVVTQLQCDGCKSKLEGQFGTGKLSMLNGEQTAFAEVFLACRGNIKEVEKVLGISYPTVRSRLDDVLAAMGYPVRRKGDKTDVLEALSRGDISIDDAAGVIGTWQSGDKKQEK